MVKRPTLGFCSGHDLKLVGLSPTSGSMPTAPSLLGILSPSLPLSLSLCPSPTHTLSQIINNFLKIKKQEEETEGPGIKVNANIFLNSPWPDVALPVSHLAKQNFYWWSNPKVTSMFSFFFIHPSGSSLDKKRARYPFLEGTGLTRVQEQPGGHVGATDFISSVIIPGYVLRYEFSKGNYFRQNLCFNVGSLV